MGDKPRHSVLFFVPASRADRETHWRPSADVCATRSGWLLKFDLAGVRPEDVQVHVHGRQITVSGVRRDSTIDEVCCCHSMEIAYNRFERTVELPCDVQGAAAQVELRNGMLLIRLEWERE